MNGFTHLCKAIRCYESTAYPLYAKCHTSCKLTDIALTGLTTLLILVLHG